MKVNPKIIKNNTMKKLLFLFTILLLISCSSEDEENIYDLNKNPDLVGTWEGDTYDSEDGPNGEPVSLLWIQLSENGAGSWRETSYLTNVTQVLKVDWGSTDTRLTFRLFEDGQLLSETSVSYKIDKSGNRGSRWALDITDDEGDMFTLFKED